MSFLDPWILWFKDGAQLPPRRRIAVDDGITVVDDPQNDMLRLNMTPPASPVAVPLVQVDYANHTFDGAGTDVLLSEQTIVSCVATGSPASVNFDFGSINVADGWVVWFRVAGTSGKIVVRADGVTLFTIDMAASARTLGIYYSALNGWRPLRVGENESAIQAAGVVQTPRETLNFIGLTVADDAANRRTNITNPSIFSVKRQQSVASANTTTLVDVPDLQFNIAAGELWIVQWVLHVSIAGASNNGVRLAGVWPSGMAIAELHGRFSTISTSLTAAAPPTVVEARSQTSAAEMIFPNPPSSLLDGYLLVDAVFHSSTAAGVVKTRMAMGSSIGGATSIDTYSYMRAMRA